jgi:hypothetical protein
MICQDLLTKVSSNPIRDEHEMIYPMTRAVYIDYQRLSDDEVRHFWGEIRQFLDDEGIVEHWMLSQTIPSIPVYRHPHTLSMVEQIVVDQVIPVYQLTHQKTYIVFGGKKIVVGCDLDLISDITGLLEDISGYTREPTIPQHVEYIRPLTTKTHQSLPRLGVDTADKLFREFHNYQRLWNDNILKSLLIFRKM